MARPRKDGNSPNELTEEQKLAALQWIAEGLDNKQINERAANFAPPFQMTPQHIYAYRKGNETTLDEMRKEREYIALSTGLAVKATRVEKLQQLADMLWEDLLTKKRIWLEDAKTVGKEPYMFEKFNHAEIEQYRAVLDDIAKETGGRVLRADITSKDKPIKGYTLVSPDAWDKLVKEGGSK